MNDMINIENKDGELLVSARELHEALEINERFSRWFDRMISYGFDENVDYVGCTKMYTANQHGGEKELEDYALKLDMAKEICMLQRNELGKQFRRYFIECEKQLMNHALPVPQQPQLIGVNPYHNRLIRKNINQLDAADIPRYVNNLLELTKSYTPSGRLNAYELTRSALENLLPTLLESFDQSMVRASLDKLNKLIENQKMCINRAEKGAKTKKIINLEHQNHELEEELNQWKEYAEELKEYYNPTRIWTTVEYHGFTNNCMYDKGHRTPAYNWWIKNFPVNQVPTKKEYEMYQGIDFTKPIGIDLHFVNMEKYDTANLMKSALDMIFNRILKVDDNIIIKPVPQTVGYCDSTDEGKIIFAIYNIEEEPEMN